MKYIRSYIIMVVICCYLERNDDKILKIHINNPSYFEMSASFF